MILLVDDDAVQQQMLSTLIQRKLQCKAVTAMNGREALDVLNDDEQGRAIALVVMDIDMPVMNGIEALEIMRQRYPALPVIMLTGSHDPEKAVTAIKMGAVDYLNKPCDGERLMVTIRNALKLSTLSKEVTRLKKEKDGTFGFENLIGFDGGLADVVGIGRKAARVDIPVLITGETGVGKEVFSLAVHGESHRAGQAFIAVNCGAIPGQLVESTLFGHEKGAFTGATERAAGKFREADAGTIFLDEVGELPLDAQVKLLRVLQQREVEPVGASRPVPVNVRVISATNRDLEEEVRAGRFREDLYFRLNVLQIGLPALRQRRQDIPALARHFIDRFCALENRPSYYDLSAEAGAYLAEQNWPGNVRELENAINRAMALSERAVLERECFTTVSGGAGQRGAVDGPVAVAADGGYSIYAAPGRFKTMEQIEQDVMALALSHFDQNVTKAAQALGIAKSTFYRKVRG